MSKPCDVRHARWSPGGLPHLPGLDGLRGLAIAAVLIYHADSRWLPGGMLGITVFFTLSGFLITSLLLRDVDVDGRPDLRRFWTRRARRLAPAALLAVLLVAALSRVGLGPLDGSRLGDAIASLTWTANWRFIAEGSTYGDLFADPSPFQHFWSLAVEEQLYLALPLVVLACIGRSGRRWPLAAVLTAGIVASTAAAAALHVPGGGTARAYFGTDARIAEPLVGALLALLLAQGGGIRDLSRRAVQVLGVASGAALLGIGALAWSTSAADPFLYNGGFLLTAVLAAVVVAALTQSTVLTRIFSAPPLTALGRISYGVYLFHWPVYLWLADELREQGKPVVVAAQVTTTLALAILSYALVEMPIRRGLGRIPVLAVGWANATVAAVAVVALTTVTATASTTVDLGATVDAAVPAPPTAATAQPAQPAPSELPRGTQAAAPRAAAPTGPGISEGEQAAPQLPPPDQPADVGDDPVVGNNGAGSQPDAPPEPESTALRVAVVGDSLGHNVATGLEGWAAEGSDVVVYNLAISACPMSRGGERRFSEYEWFRVDPKCAWWDDPYSERATNFIEFDPDIVVIEASLNELLDRRPDGWTRWVRPGDPQYHQWLLEEYGLMFDRMTSMAGDDTQFLILNAVCADFGRHPRWQKVEDTDGRVQALNQSVFPLMVEANQGDLYAELCPNGEFESELWGIEDARPDGIHLSDEAAIELARRWLGPMVLELGNQRGMVDAGM